MRSEGWVEDMGRCKRLVVIRARGEGRQRPSIEDSFDLDEDGVEGIDVDLVSQGQGSEMPLEQSNESLPRAAAMRSPRRNEGPLQALTLEGISDALVPNLHFPFQDLVRSREVGPLIGHEVRRSRTASGEPDDSVDEGVRIHLVDQFHVD